MEEYNSRILQAKQAIKQADYIIIGAGSGLSAAAGLEYSEENFEKNYKDFIERYHFEDLYSASFYDFGSQEEKWIQNTVDCKIPSNLVMKCPICGGNMDMNLRKDANFVQDSNWYAMSQKYDDFLSRTKDKNMVLLEIGVGFNTPGIIRFPFEQMTNNSKKTTLIRINKDYPSTMLEIENKTISFNEDTNKIIESFKKLSSHIGVESKENDIVIHSCCEKNFLSEYGLKVNGCMSQEIAS